MPGRCVLAGCSISPDVQNGIIIHTIPFFNDNRPEARKCRKKWVDFIKPKRAKWELTRNSSVCSKHFTKDDYMCHFMFIDEVTKKPYYAKERRNRYKCSAIRSCRSSDQKASCH